MIKILLTGIFSLAALLCSAQKQVLSYQDFQYIMQNSPEQVKSFLEQKDYHVQPAFGSNETRFFTLFADTDYTDLTVKTSGRNKSISITTTHTQQVEDLQKAVSFYPNKNSKGFKTYKVKDGKIATVGITENNPDANTNKIYTIQLEN